MYSFSNLVIQSSVNALGTDTVAAWAAYGKIDSTYWMIINALGISITTFVGQNYGAGRLDRVKRSVYVCLGISCIITVGLSTILYLTGGYIYLLFTTDAEVIAIGMKILHFLVPAFVTYLCIEIYSGALRGVGDCSDDYDGAGRVRPAGCLDPDRCSDPPGYPDSGIQLSADLDDHNGSL